MVSKLVKKRGTAHQKAVPLKFISPPAPPAPSTPRTAAPTAFHNPLSARQSLPGTARRCGRGRLSGSGCWSTAAARRPAPGRAKGPHGGYSRSGPSSAYRPRHWKCRPRPCARVSGPARPPSPSRSGACPVSSLPSAFLPFPAPSGGRRLLHLCKFLFLRPPGERRGREVIQYAVQHVPVLFLRKLHGQ